MAAVVAAVVAIVTMIEAIMAVLMLTITLIVIKCNGRIYDREVRHMPEM